MQNFIFISPNFPTNYWQFCHELKNNGMNDKRTQNLLIRRQEKTGRAGIKPCLPAAYNN